MNHLSITHSIHDGAEYIKSSNLMLDYYHCIPDVISACVDDKDPVRDLERFSPGFKLPEVSQKLVNFFSCADAVWWDLGAFRERNLFLLDLMRNPNTQTTKTFASLLIVARAVEYIHQTGESIVIFCPTSGNKGIALRDAVERAITCGLVSKDQLSIVILLPHLSKAKLRESLLSTDSDLARLNPVMVYDGPQADTVKKLAREFIDTHAAAFRQRRNAWLWYSLDLRNYKIADAARAFFELDASPTVGSRARIHAHAVSSAYGLLGYNLGREVLEAEGRCSPSDRPGFLLVQHLGTPDMVLSHRFGSFDRAGLPKYREDLDTGIFVQKEDPHFPARTLDPQEVVDRTFYTHSPPTSREMNGLIERFGGTGIVVSLLECIERYAWIRRLLSQTDLHVPRNPRDLTEWSLAMVFTGVVNAIERALLPEDRDIVVHGSGFYSRTDYAPIHPSAVRTVSSVEDVTNVFMSSA